MGNQEFRKSGFNRRTVDAVSRLDGQTISKISQEAGFRDREVSELVKSQIRELLEMDANINGILLSQLPTEYNKYNSYHIDEADYGFTNLEDFCLNGIADVADLDLDCGNFKIVEKGLIGRTRSISVPKNVPNKVKVSFQSLMRNNERREMSLEVLRRKYSETFEPLKLFEFGCLTFLELCLLLPDCLRLRLSAGGDWICQSAEPETLEATGDLSQVAANVAELLQGHKDSLDLKVFIEGYDGYHGSIHKAVKHVGASGVKDLLSKMEDVCKLETASDGKVMVRPTQLSPVTADVINDIQSLLEKHPAGLAIADLPQSYLEHTGKMLDTFNLGVQSLVSLCLHLSKDPTNDIERRGSNLHLSSQDPRTGPLTEPQSGHGEKLQTGWVRVVQVRGAGLLVVQQERKRRDLRDLEDAMEEFYTVKGGGKEVEVTSGLLVAALYTDLAWHRARVLRLRSGWALVDFTDWGWQGWVSLHHVRHLHTTFTVLHSQASSVTRECSTLIGPDP